MNCFAANIHITERLAKQSTQGRQKELPFMFGRGVFSFVAKGERICLNANFY